MWFKELGATASPCWVVVDDPWGYGNSLAWAPVAPAAAQLHRAAPNPFGAPAFELHYPHMVERMRAEAHVGRAHGPDDDDVTRASTTNTSAT